jgi:putative spermidine/putrescine transport system permease protein
LLGRRAWRHFESGGGKMSLAITGTADLSWVGRRSGGNGFANAFLYWGMLVALTFFLVFFLAPMLYMLVESFKPPMMSGETKAFTFENYRSFVAYPLYRTILLRTLRVAAMSSLVMLLCGYPVAYLLRIVTPRTRSRLFFFVISPMLVSVVVRTYGWVVILGKEGMLNSVLAAAGIDNEFSRSTHLFNETTVVIGVAHVFIPLMILAIYNSLQKVNFSLLKAAANLGAPPYRVFLEVTLPLTLPGIVAGLATVFPLAMGSFITVAVLGGSAVWVVSMSAYQQATTLLNWQFAGAIGAALLISVTLIVGLFTFAMSRVVREQGRP